MMMLTATVSSLSDWFNMNGDGAYVWPCYVITAFVLIINVWITRRRYRLLLKEAMGMPQAGPRQPEHRVQGGGQ